MMATQSVQKNNLMQSTAEIRLPILLFSSVLMGVLLALWVTASFTSSAENNEADNRAVKAESMNTSQGIADRQQTPALCALHEDGLGDC